MKIASDILLRYWALATAEQLTRDYMNQGYNVQRDSLIGDYEADLVARKGSEILVAEIKTGPWSKDVAEKARVLRNKVVHELGGRFELVWSRPPADKTIEVEEIETILLQALDLQVQESEAAELATHVKLEEIADVELTSMAVTRGGIEVTGYATASLKLQYGSNSDQDSDMGATSTDSFLVDFTLLLGPSLGVEEVRHFAIDVSDFYE